jgi:hypothetical protein
MRSPKRWYIREVDREGRTALYGPFPEDEINDRLNDEYADMLEADLANVDAIIRSDRQMRGLFINSPESWHAARAEILAFEALVNEDPVPEIQDKKD